MRKAAIDSLFMVAGALPEEGRSNLIADKVAAEAGQAAVERYYPRKQPVAASEQQAEATQWVGVMRAGVPAVVTSTQNATVYATTFMAAAVEAVKSLQMGAQPQEILKFLSVIGPAIAAQIRRLAQDPTREQVFKQLTEQWQQLGAISDKLKGLVQRMEEGKQAQRQKTQEAMSDQQIKQLKVGTDIALKTAKTKAQLAQSREKQQAKLAEQRQAHGAALTEKAQGMVIKDATASADIRRADEVARAEIEMARQAAAESGAEDRESEGGGGRFRIIRR